MDLTEHTYSYITVNEIKLVANNNYTTYCTEHTYSHITVDVVLIALNKKSKINVMIAILRRLSTALTMTHSFIN
jgi:hypothetical protein